MISSTNALLLSFVDTTYFRIAVESNKEEGRLRLFVKGGSQRTAKLDERHNYTQYLVISPQYHHSPLQCRGTNLRRLRCGLKG